MHRYGIKTTQPFSKYASPILAQRKPNGKLRLLVELRKINALISDDYKNNNHPINTLSDAAQHLAGKKLFCKLDCSQAYHCLQMADQKSVELLAFNFASRTFANKRLAQELSRILSAFSSFMREYLDKLKKRTNVPNTLTTLVMQLTRSLNQYTTSEQFLKTGLKLAIEECHFGVIRVKFLGRTITPLEEPLKTTKSRNSLPTSASRKRVNKFNDTLDSSIITETIYRGYQKN